VSKASTRLEDLASKAGVSISTASRALNDSPLVNMRTKQEIWKLAREMDYPFRKYMPAGPVGADATITLIIPRPQGREGRLFDPFFSELLTGVAEAARERGCDLLVSHMTPTSYEHLDNAMSTSRSAGVIFMGQSSLHKEFNRLTDQYPKFVVWGAELSEQHYCSIGSDNFVGGRRATSHLARLGRKRIVFLGETEAPEVMRRYRGYLEGLERFGLPVDQALHVSAHLEVESGEASIDGLIKSGIEFDGVVAASDLIALGAVRALIRSGRRVPEDVSVIGYDNIPFARYSSPALSTVGQDTARAGRLLVSKLLDSSGGGAVSERVATDLVIRGSCGG